MDSTYLIVARHGNTFSKEDIPTRVGARTDLPLVASGKEQAIRIGRYLKERCLIPDAVYCGALKRSFETAQLAMEYSGAEVPVIELESFNEIDYGPDENKSEAEVIQRIGKAAIDAWDMDAVVPPGWNVDPKEIIRSWIDFSSECASERSGKVTLLVTSNGIARFAPHITGDYASFKAKFPIKIKTGAISIFVLKESGWTITEWNLRPE